MVTTVLELLGLLLVVAALALAVAVLVGSVWAVPAGLVVAGLGLIGVSGLITWRGRR